MSYARIYFYECAENLLSFARFNCAVFITWTFKRYPAHNSNQKYKNEYIFDDREVRSSVAFLFT